MIRDCAMLGIPVDPLALFECDDENALIVVREAIHAVSDMNRRNNEEQQRARQKARGG
jgi:hypothetical protein